MQCTKSYIVYLNSQEVQFYFIIIKKMHCGFFFLKRLSSYILLQCNNRRKIFYSFDMSENLNLGIYKYIYFCCKVYHFCQLAKDFLDFLVVGLIVWTFFYKYL